MKNLTWVVASHSSVLTIVFPTSFSFQLFTSTSSSDMFRTPDWKQSGENVDNSDSTSGPAETETGSEGEEWIYLS